jgi:hypothetical protein
MLHRNNSKYFVTRPAKASITPTYKNTANEADESRQQRPSSGTLKSSEKGRSSLRPFLFGGQASAGSA